MIEQGYSGRKGKGGFYRLNTEGGQKIKEVRDLATGEYHAQGDRVELTGLDPAKEDIKALVTHPEAGAYAWAVLSDTLCYAASLVPAIADGIAAVDEAMRKGYNWKHGPFEMIDKLGVDWFIGKLEEEGRAVPHLLEAARGKSFYITEGGKRLALGTDGKYTPVVDARGLSDAGGCQTPRAGASGRQQRRIPVGHGRRDRLPRVDHEGQRDHARCGEDHQGRHQTRHGQSDSRGW